MALLCAGSTLVLKTASPLPRHHQLGRALPSRSRSSIVSATLGFTTDQRIQIERAADGLLKDVASLLVYQEVFRSPPAQAFLKLLLVLRRRDDDIKILEAYGEFFRLMAAGRHSSWQDFLLEGILKADGNPFAEAAAGIGDSSSTYAGIVPPSLEAAAIADLESLQRLSLNETTMISWVTELVSDTKPQWRSAASASLGSSTVPKLEEKKPKVPGFMVPDEEKEASENKPLAAPSETQTIKTETEVDLVISERRQWQKQISSLWNWSEAVPLLKDYHAKNGFGRFAASQVLRLRGGKLVPDFFYLVKLAGPHYNIWPEQASSLRETIEQHVSQGSSLPRHILVHGDSGHGKSWLVRATLRELSEKLQFRVLLLPPSDLKQLSSLLHDMEKNSGVRFVLVVEDLLLRSAEDNYLLLKAALDEHEQEWPRNVLLCATSSILEAKIGGETVKLVHLFSLALYCKTLEFMQYLKEILRHKGAADSLDEKKALAYASKHGCTIRSAVRYSELYHA